MTCLFDPSFYPSFTWKGWILFTLLSSPCSPLLLPCPSNRPTLLVCCLVLLPNSPIVEPKLLLLILGPP